MMLVFQMLGFLAGGVVLTRVLAPGTLQSTRFPVTGIGLVVALVAGVLFWDHVWQIGSGLPESTRTASLVSPFVAQHEPDPGANNAFLEWARKKMLVGSGSQGTYYLEPVTILTDPLLSLWTTYELLPERETSTLREADWIVYYATTPHLMIEQSRSFAKIFRFSPDSALALRSNAR
jgi:hypothetical protein